MLLAEQKYSVTEQELLACVHALKIGRCYLEGAAEFWLHTDHGANTFLDTQPSLSRRQARWQEFLSRFHFTWKFLPGVRNNVADPLSRRPVTSESTGTCRPHLGLMVMTRGAKARDESQAPSVSPDPQGATALARPSVDQSTDGSRPSSAAAAPSLPDMPSISDVPDIPNTLPGTEHWRDRLIAGYALDPWFSDQNNLKDLSLDEGLYYNIDGRVIIPDSGDLRLKLISDFHDSPYVGHVGINKTTRLLSRYIGGLVWTRILPRGALMSENVTLVRLLRLVRRNLQVC